MTSRSRQDVIQRVGVRPEKQLHWLLEFQELALETLNQEAWETLLEAYNVFSQAPWEDLSALRAWGKAIVPSEVSATPNDTIERLLISQLCQVPVRQAITDLLDHGFARFPAVTVHPEVRRGQKELSVTAGETLHDHRFIYQAANVLQQCISKLARCPECKKIFVRARRDRRYCGNRCHSRVRMQTWRIAKRAKREKQERERQRKNRQKKPRRAWSQRPKSRPRR